MNSADGRRQPTGRFGRMAVGVLLVAVLAGLSARLSVLSWSDPWGPHQADEHILPLEALALWEGITPREVGWPASTLRLVLSAELAVDWIWREGPETWQMRHDPGGALTRLSEWIGNHYVDPTPLYKLGRATSVFFGVLQLLALVWALRQWVGPWGVAIGTLSVAIGPLPVLYSQFVLADIVGVLFATLLVGLAARVSTRRVLAMGIVAGLATASKFHFGLWLMTGVLAIWLSRDFDVLSKARLTAVSLLGAAWVFVTLVPWSWSNPLLFLKEFAGVVLVKVASGPGGHSILTNVATVYEGTGTIAWVGAGLGLLMVRRMGLRSSMPVVVPLVLGTLALSVSTVVFDRYGLVLLPGVAILCGTGWEALLEHSRLRVPAVAGLVLCLVTTSVALVRAERRAGEVDVDVLARQWILAHVPSGARVALHDEDNAFLPRNADQLRSCVSYVRTPAAYMEKWRTEDAGAAPAEGEPERAAVLTDEAAAAYWCERELSVARENGYVVVAYHDGPRFNTRLESDAINEFKSNASGPAGEIDVLVLNREVDAGVSPAEVLRTAEGVRVIYVAQRIR